MKIKNSFVTNSSSTSFIVIVKPYYLDSFLDSIAEMNQHPDAEEECGLYYIFKNIDELNEYTNDEPIDWISKITGPKFVNLNKESYLKCKEEIEKNNYICEVFIDNNLCEYFDDLYNMNIIQSS